MITYFWHLKFFSFDYVYPKYVHANVAFGMQVKSYVHVIYEDVYLELDPNLKSLKNLVLVWVLNLFT
jgi:hypothetical protein